jgi:vacuolar-type H+-ATPase subunit I/STV1
MNIRLVGVLTLGAALLVGCDAKNDPVDDILKEAQQAQVDKREEMLEQLDSGEGMSPDTEHVGDVAKMLEDAAEGSDAQLAETLNEQAQVLRQLQALVKPYEDTLNAFSALGGLDVNTFASADDFLARIELVDQLIAINETMDKGFPELIRQLGGEPAIIDQKLDLIAQIRQSDRDLFPSMKRYLEILQAYWDQVAPQESGDIFFRESVPDEVVQEFNVHAQKIQELSTLQITLQRALLMLDAP